MRSALAVIVPGFTLERRKDGPFLQPMRPTLIVTVVGGPQHGLARRGRVARQGLRAAAAAQARAASPGRALGEAA
jgi:hypothetical protein